jgi:transcriptional regulator with XRE-family HTH domain
MRIYLVTMRRTRAGQRLVGWLKGSGISQDEFASRVTAIIRQSSPEAKHVNQSSVSSWVLGKNIPRGAMMVAIQSLTGIPVTEWLEPARDSGEYAIAIDRAAGAA